MQTLKKCLVLLTVIALHACGPSAEKMQNLEEQALLSSSPISKSTDTLVQMHYSMAVDFEVENTVSTTLLLEHLCNTAGGYIENSKTTKNCISTTTVQIKKDSSEIITNYNYSTILKIQVPVENVNYFIDSLAHFSSDLRMREISGKNLSAQIVDVRAQTKELGNSYEDFQKDFPDAKTTKTTVQQQLETKSNYMAMQSKVQSERTNLQLQKSYVSIDLSFDDKPTLKREKIAIAVLPPTFGSDFGSQVLQAISFGTSLLKSIFLLLLNIWPLILLLVLLLQVKVRQQLLQLLSKSTFQNSNRK